MIFYSRSFQQILGHVPFLEATIDRDDRDRDFSIMIQVTFHFCTLTLIMIFYSLSFQQILGHVPILEATIDRDDRGLRFLVANWD